MTEIRHGYTLGDLDRIARSACTADRSMASDIHTRYSVAWSAIAEHLCAADSAPAVRDLTRVGWQAIYTEVRQMRHTYGQDRDDPNAEVASMPRAQQYWFLPPVEPDLGLIEHLAVHQILAMLTPIQREAVVALAVCDDYRQAAASLGLKYSAFTARMSVARKVFRRYWFAPDQAPPIRNTDRRVEAYGKVPQTHCSGGHELAGDNVRVRRDRRERVCRACERERAARRSPNRKLHHPLPEACRLSKARQDRYGALIEDVPLGTFGSFEEAKAAGERDAGRPLAWESLCGDGRLWAEPDWADFNWFISPIPLPEDGGSR